MPHHCLPTAAALSAVLACGLGSPSYNDTALLVSAAFATCPRSLVVLLVLAGAKTAIESGTLGAMSGSQVQGLTAADVANCSVYILDVSAELAGPAGIPTCSISDPKASRCSGCLDWNRAPADLCSSCCARPPHSAWRQRLPQAGRPCRALQHVSS